MDDYIPMRDAYTTKDLYIASFLQVKGQKIKHLDNRRNGTRDIVYFIFEDIEKCEQLEALFWSGQGDEAMVNIKEYFIMIRELKSRISLVRRTFNRTSQNPS